MDDSAVSRPRHIRPRRRARPGAPGRGARVPTAPRVTWPSSRRRCAGSRLPVIMLGTGAIAHTAAIRSALAGRGIPALHTYRARGIVPDSTAEAAGLVTGGTMEWPLLAAADLIVGLGSTRPR